MTEQTKQLYGPGAKEPHIWCGEDDGHLTERHTPAKTCDSCDYLYKTHPNLLDSDDPQDIAELVAWLNSCQEDLKRSRFSRALRRFVNSFLGKR